MKSLYRAESWSGIFWLEAFNFHATYSSKPENILEQV